MIHKVIPQKEYHAREELREAMEREKKQLPDYAYANPGDTEWRYVTQTTSTNNTGITCIGGGAF